MISVGIGIGLAENDNAPLIRLAVKDDQLIIPGQKASQQFGQTGRGQQQQLQRP